MKNVRKRFLSLIMAMMMVLSCVATASASDVADTTSAVDDSVVVLSSTDGDDGIMPLSYGHYLKVEGTCNKDVKFERSFKTESEQKVRIRFAVVGSAHSNIKLQYGGSIRTLYDDDYTNFSMDQVTGNCPKGMKFIVTLTIKSNNTSVALVADPV